MRKAVKIDRQALRDLVESLVKYRNGIDYLDQGSVNMAISGLSQITNFHQDVVFEVTIQDEELTSCFEPFDDYGELMTFTDFAARVEVGNIIDDDGIGYYATRSKRSIEEIHPSDVLAGNINRTYTHVVWFSK